MRLLLLFIGLLSFGAHSKNLALIIGGVHSSDLKSRNPFREDVKMLVDVLTAKKWETMGLLGENPKSRDDWFRPSTNENVKKILEIMTRMCDRDDQALILFQGHGVPASEKFPSSSHFISAEFKPLLNVDAFVPYL